MVLDPSPPPLLLCTAPFKLSWMRAPLLRTSRAHTAFFSLPLSYVKKDLRRHRHFYSWELLCWVIKEAKTLSSMRASMLMCSFVPHVCWHTRLHMDTYQYTNMYTHIQKFKNTLPPSYLTCAYTHAYTWIHICVQICTRIYKNYTTSRSNVGNQRHYKVAKTYRMPRVAGYFRQKSH